MTNLLNYFGRSSTAYHPKTKDIFIQHWTGTPKLPAEWTADMELTIAKNTNDQRMFAQTCFNKLSLPDLNVEEEMR